MNQRWCAICYHRRRNINGIVDADEINDHYEANHSSRPNEWPKTDKQKSYLVGYSNNKPYLIDDIAVASQQELESKYDAAVLLFHDKTERDITDRIQQNIPYVIAWFGKPIRSAKNNYYWSINTLWTREQDALFMVRINDLLSKYRELREYLETEYDEVMDDIYERTPKNVDTMSLKDKSLRIIREIKRCGTWIKSFIKPVDEIKNHAPNYYKIIQHPMDLQTLKELIDSNKIKTAKEFCHKFMLIWNNAQKYNPKTHKVHESSIKCQFESKRLIKKYFPEMFDESQSNELSKDSKKFAIVKYGKNGKTKVRKCLLCTICNKSLRLILGFHTNCTSQFSNTLEWDLQKNCSQCHRNINDTSIGYYHCMEGCNNSDHDEASIFLCEICAANHYDSKQIPQSYAVRNLPFYGLWIDLCSNGNCKDIWYEAIIMEQEANRVFYKLVFSSDNLDITNDQFGETAATITQCNDNELIFHIDTANGGKPSSDFTLCKLNMIHSNHSILKFVDTVDAGNENVYKKVIPKCNLCNVDMLFMMKDRIETNENQEIHFCDVHEDYYEKNKAMKKSKQCLSFNAFKYDNISKNRIHSVGFYFTCIKCKKFDICGGCILIKMEQEFKNKKNTDMIQYNYMREPATKKQRISSSESIVTQISGKKRKREELNELDEMNELNESIQNIQTIDLNDDDMNYKQLYLREKEKNKKLLLELQKSNQMVTKWRSKYNKFYSKVQGVLLNNKKSPPPLGK